MRILHLPVNISSQVSCTVRALRSIGAEASGLVRQSSVIQDCAGVETIDWSGKVKGVSRLTRGLRWRFTLLRRIAWAEVVHWHWGDTTWRGLDLRYIAWLKKPRLVEFWGGDLRDPAMASKDNPFVKGMLERNPERVLGRSVEAQTMFAKSGFDALIPGYELADYLRPGLLPGYYQTRPRLMLEDYLPRYPQATQRKPLLVHAPSEKTVKGTEAVTAAISKLAHKHSFDFQLLHNLPRARALEVVASCDVFLDQFVLGCEGLAAHEAMALGKPVVCFIKPSLLPRYPESLPIVVADQHTLPEAIAGLVENAARRHHLGVCSRQYIERYHDARKVAAELMEIYSDVLAARRMEDDQHKPASRNRHWHAIGPATAVAEGVA